MEVNEYQTKCLRTSGKYEDTVISAQYMELLNGVLGLEGESGECADHLKKHLFQGHPFDRDHLIKELGDVAWYISLCAHALNAHLEEVFQTNIDKLIERYPDGFKVSDSINRKENDI